MQFHGLTPAAFLLLLSTNLLQDLEIEVQAFFPDSKLRPL